MLHLLQYQSSLCSPPYSLMIFMQYSLLIDEIPIIFMQSSLLIDEIPIIFMQSSLLIDEIPIIFMQSFLLIDEIPITFNDSVNAWKRLSAVSDDGTHTLSNWCCELPLSHSLPLFQIAAQGITRYPRFQHMLSHQASVKKFSRFKSFN